MNEAVCKDCGAVLYRTKDGELPDHEHCGEAIHFCKHLEILESGLPFCTISRGHPLHDCKSCRAYLEE